MISAVIIWILMGVYLLLVVGTVFVVLLENRQPERTIAWVVALVLLPVLGLVAFYFFGQNIRRRHRLGHKKKKALRRSHRKKDLPAKNRKAESTLPASAINTPTEKEGEGEQDAAQPFSPFLPLQNLCTHEFHAPLLPLGKVQILTNGTAFLEELLDMCHAAQHFLFIETYIIEEDEVGRQVAEALKDAASRGVRVRLLYDDVGCWRVAKRFFKAMREAGVEAEAFMPVRFPSLTHKINYRNHRKIAVADGIVGMIGGMNIALRYMGREDYIWRDLHLRLEGEAVSRLEEIFRADWTFVTSSSQTALNPSAQGEVPASKDEGTTMPKRLRPNGRDKAQTTMQIVTSDPFSHVPQLMYAYTWAAMHTSKYLYVQTPYFMPTEPFLQALKTAALGGADVRVMMPRKPDGIMLRRINDSYVSELLAVGIRVFLFEDGFLHSKSIAIDDAWCTVGSANMDFRSFLNNIEVGALIYDTATCTAVRQVFEEDLKYCREIDPERWARRPLRRRLQESATRILSPLF